MKLVCRYCGHTVRYQDGEKVLVYEIETGRGTVNHDRKGSNA